MRTPGHGPHSLAAARSEGRGAQKLRPRRMTPGPTAPLHGRRSPGPHSGIPEGPEGTAPTPSACRAHLGLASLRPVRGTDRVQTRFY
ncbi:hypothetical protein NDU88_004625 [Pleurodeles waltl]|uniref:Uncharacterized protein n=1 Tax=Pleurodeles waltl TaxID=8319 RepID=A0AAV7NT08_PLEWA|nr:hypothetical protein NDU88_004625 [Pleurodeles waltl]